MIDTAKLEEGDLFYWTARASGNWSRAWLESHRHLFCGNNHFNMAAEIIELIKKFCVSINEHPGGGWCARANGGFDVHGDTLETAVCRAVVARRFGLFFHAEMATT